MIEKDTVFGVGHASIVLDGVAVRIRKQDAIVVVRVASNIREYVVVAG